MANTIKVKRSNVSGKVPTPLQVVAGEPAINTADKKMYFGIGSEVVQLLSTYDSTVIQAQIASLAALIALMSNSTSTTVISLTTTEHNQTLCYIPIDLYRSATLMLQVSSGAQYQTSTVNLIHNGINVFINETNLITTGVLLANYDASIVNGDIVVTAIPALINTTFTLVSTYIKV